MDPSLAPALSWWITMVELPVIGALFWMLWRIRRDTEQALDAERRRADAAMAALTQTVADYKLEVAQTFASVADVNEVERRLVGHLLRIEAKLDYRLGEAPRVRAGLDPEPYRS